MSGALVALVASGIAGAGVGAVALARRVARSGAPRETRGWATGAGFTLGAALAPWAFTSALLGWMPETGAVRREVVRVEGPTPEQVRSLVGTPRPPRCVEERVIAHEENNHPHSGHQLRTVRSRCEGGSFLHTSEDAYGEGERWTYSTWMHGSWDCESVATQEGRRGASERRHELRVRRSRGGHFLEFTCVLTTCRPEDHHCRPPSPGALYFAAEPLTLEDRRAVTVTFAAAVALALAWVVRHTPRALSPVVASPYRERPPAERVVVRAPLRRALVAITFAFGAAAAVSWAVVGYAFSR